MADSVFSSIARGETDAHRIYESERVIAILDVNPARPGHTILFPKEEFQVLGQLPDDLLAELFVALRKIRHATVLLDPSIEGVTSIIAQGTAAGQRAPHLLVHTIPRSSGDGLFSRADGPASQADRATVSQALASLDLLEGQRVELADPASARGELVLVDGSADLFESLDDRRTSSFGSLIRSASSTVFKAIGAEGTTIAIESGLEQRVLGAEARVFPRWQNDGLDLSWTPGGTGDLRGIAEGFARVLGSRTPRAEASSAVPHTAPNKNDREARAETNYLLEQLKRLP